MKHFIFFVIQVVFLMLSLNAIAQNEYDYVEIPCKYFKPPTYQLTAILGKYPDRINLTSFLPNGYVKDGTIDYTPFLQKGIDNNEVVVLPDFPVLVNSKGLTLRNGSVLIFNSNSKLLLKSNNSEFYEVLRIHNVQNVRVYNAVIIGDRYTHTGSTGQWGMGIAIRSSKDISIFQPNITGCWGDGIYIGQINSVPSENILIEGATLDKNRRNGVSVTSVDGLRISNSIIANSFGQAPASGIDIEPNTSRDIINNIEISNIITFNNFKYGIIISLNKLAGQFVKEVCIKISNHVDIGSAGGLAINRVYGDYSILPFKGEIEIVNSVWKNNRGDNPFYYIKQKHGYKLKVGNFNVLKTNKMNVEIKDTVSISKIKAKLNQQTEN